MRADDLTPEQCAQIRESVRPALFYLHRLLLRMDDRHFPPQDPLRLKAKAAYDALHALTVELHYRSCPGQTGRR
jgi:hypothetical protein